jgi:hypothetical protein
MVLYEIDPDLKLQDVQAVTEAMLHSSPSLKVMTN